MNLTKMMMTSTLIGMMFLGFTGCTKSAEPAKVMSVKETALNGYDPVAYFISSKAVQADTINVYVYEDLAWHFESRSNMERFTADPNTYIPAFGGFCAYELAEGKFVQSDPEVWYIYNNKLYLFKDKDAKQKWFRNIDTMMVKAEEAWKLLTHPVEEEQFEEIGDSFMKASSSENNK